MEYRDNFDETYWHQKHPVRPQLYRGRPVPVPRKQGEVPKNYLIDIRRFVWGDDLVLQRLIADQKLAKTHIDATALAIQKWIVKFMTYVGDDQALYSPEFWLFPAETLNMAHGDCEDGAILMASLLINALPPEDKWRVRCVAGLVKAGPTAPTGGHMWVEYFREADNQPVVLDWCYLEDSHKPVALKPVRDDAPHIVETWFSTNDKYTWAHGQLDLSGRMAKERA